MYPSLNPFTIRREKAREVFRLFRLIKQNNKYSKNENDNSEPIESIRNDGTRLIRKNVTGKRGTGGWI